jgi:hypothetical protein
LKFSCSLCNLVITHDKLRVAKISHDIQGLLEDDLPMPGTLLSRHGVPENAKSPRHPSCFPNRLIRNCISQQLLKLTDFSLNENASMKQIHDFLQEALKDSSLVRANKNIMSGITDSEQFFLRKSMSRYWENSSPFALDLVGAVIRQATFVTKMYDIDWIHSPALESIMKRLISKYSIFFRIICDNPTRVAVPTLDVDLAWHTHQLSPARYYSYSYTQTKGRFIDHDDKIEEKKLSDAFEWTSKQYQHMTGGQVYSECICWYCEAIRELHNHHHLFSSKITAAARANAAQLQERSDVNSDPTKNPHISAHNAVRDRRVRGVRMSVMLRGNILHRKYEKALKRAYKRGSVDPSLHPKTGRVGHGYLTPARVWGYPMTLPYRAPYTVDPCIHGLMYPCNPDRVDVELGAAGSCLAGACGVVSASCGMQGSGTACAGGGGACGGGGGGCASSGGGGGGGCASSGGGGGGCGGGGGGGGGC